mgnify:CR=1 FL=1
MDPKDQNGILDEIMAQIDAIQRESRLVEETQKAIDEHEQNHTSNEENASVVDESLFDQIKNGKSDAESLSNKSAIRRFLDGEEDENDEDEEYVGNLRSNGKELQDIVDFENEDERDEIYRDLKNTVGKMAIKTLAFFCIAAVSIYLYIAQFYPVLFGGEVNGIFYNIALLLVDVSCLFLSFGIFVSGLKRLLRGRADTDTLLALLTISLFVVRIAELIRPEFIPHVIVLEPMLAIGLFFNVRAKKKIASNIKNNFKLASMREYKLTVSTPSSCEAINDLILETGEGGGAMFAHKTKLLSRYIDHSYSDFSYDEKFTRYFFVSIILIIAGAVAVSQLGTLGEALLFPAAALALSVPFFSRYYFALSILVNGKKIRKKGGVLTSAASAKALEDSDLMVISEEDFLENDGVLLQGVKAIGNLQIDDLITNIAALFNCIGTPLKPLFLKMIDQRTVSLPRVDDIYYHEGLGYSCLIHSKLFLIGNKVLMEQFNVEFPSELLNLKLKESHFPVYVAYHKSAEGIFIVSYERSKRTAEAIDLIEKECVSVGLVSNNFLFNLDMLKRLYPSIQLNLFHLISPKTGMECKDFLERQEKSADLLASISGPKGLVACLYGASKLLTALKINTVIRVVYPLISIALMFFIALAGYSANTALQILAFQAIWFVPVWIVCAFCK